MRIDRLLDLHVRTEVMHEIGEHRNAFDDGGAHRFILLPGSHVDFD